MQFYAFRKGITGYNYEVLINAGSISSARQKLVVSGYNKGKWLLVPKKNIINLENHGQITKQEPTQPNIPYS